MEIVTRLMLRKCSFCGGTGVSVRGIDLRNKRKKRGLTLMVVSRRMGVSISHLSDLENDKRTWNHLLVSKYERALR